MPPQLGLWADAPTLSRFALALALGLFVGIEREHRRKEAGLRTFAFASMLGAIGGLLGDHFAMLALGLLGVMVVLLNMETIRTGEGAELTTSTALLVMGFIGVLAGQGHTLAPTVLGVTTAALLAWKEPLAGFSRALTDGEMRSAILLAILAFVIYPILPMGSVDPWHLVEPRAAWVTVVIIAALGFVNYVLLKLYGTRGIELAAFLGGLVNSTIAIAALANRVEDSRENFADMAYRGAVLAVAAMLLRNAVLLGLLAPRALLAAAPPLTLMFVGAVVAMRRSPATGDVQLAAGTGAHTDGSEAERSMSPGMRPFSLSVALEYGAIFLVLQIAGTLAQRTLGHGGFYAVSALGGLASSASAVASAGTLSASGTVPASVAALGAIIASITSALVNLPVFARVANDRALTHRIAWVVGSIMLLGLLGGAAVTWWL